jgi:2-oxoglutarate ferredoxin oxidoreductase subunit gamma
MILATAGMKQGKTITWYPSYGSEMRGGTANCNVKISDEEIASPYAKKLDVLLTLNEASIEKFERMVKSGGVLLVNSSMVKEGRLFRDDIRVIKVAASDIANELENPRGTNIAMLGALAKATGLFEADFLRETIDDYFGQRGKINPKNALCFDEGFESAQ